MFNTQIQYQYRLGYTKSINCSTTGTYLIHGMWSKVGTQQTPVTYQLPWQVCWPGSTCKSYFTKHKRERKKEHKITEMRRRNARTRWFTSPIGEGNLYAHWYSFATEKHPKVELQRLEGTRGRWCPREQFSHTTHNRVYGSIHRRWRNYLLRSPIEAFGNKPYQESKSTNEAQNVRYI